MREILSPQEISHYKRDGYLVPDYRLSGERLAKLQQLTEQLVADNPTLLNKAIVGLHVPGAGPQGLKTTKDWVEVATDPDILDMVSQLIGPDLILWDCQMFYKRSGGGPATPWHRDGRYWPIKPLATTSVWIAVYDSVIENGCLRVIPGSHQKKEIGRHLKADREDTVFPQYLAEDEFDESQAKSVELKAGEMVIFDVYTIHGAEHNNGTRPRAGVSIRYIPSASHFDHDAADLEHARQYPGAAHQNRPLMLVRGVDRCGLNDFSRGHPVQTA
ncbi:MAG: phytanoyl-CoA dioxygenase family protein [Ramlibacter sp.]|nr:phytanoyl-CoA dioxygenase family protein [Ramlibacter sp.]